jgi:4,5-DOPA dioxygenase extradiol
MLPTWFVSHGSPMFAIEPGVEGVALRDAMERLRRTHDVRSVLIMSPHWMTEKVVIGGATHPKTWHDFGGFPPELYQLSYPAPGSPTLAARIGDLLDAADYEVEIDATRPFDHGAWVPMMHVLPAAQVPIVQLSLPQSATARDVHDLGKALSPLRREGVLIVGSGSFTHNLSEFFQAPQPQDAPVTPYVREFSEWVEMALELGDDRLLYFPERVPQAKRAHPTDEHFLPLFLAWGASGSGKAQPITRQVRHGSLSMAAYEFA